VALNTACFTPPEGAFLASAVIGTAATIADAATTAQTALPLLFRMCRS
jgi:hypothetical protein